MEITGKAVPNNCQQARLIILEALLTHIDCFVPNKQANIGINSGYSDAKRESAGDVTLHGTLCWHRALFFNSSAFQMRIC